MPDRRTTCETPKSLAFRVADARLSFKAIEAIALSLKEFTRVSIDILTVS